MLRWNFFVNERGGKVFQPFPLRGGGGSTAVVRHLTRIGEKTTTYLATGAQVRVDAGIWNLGHVRSLAAVVPVGSSVSHWV